MLESQPRVGIEASGALVFISTIIIALVSLLSLVGGVLMVMLLAPHWAVAWMASVVGPTPRVYWYLSRAAGLVAYGLVWFSVCLGLLMTNRLARVWPGGPTTNDLHQFTSLLSLALTAVHYGSFGVYVLVTLHSLTAGTDTFNPVVLTLYGLSSLIIVALTVYRVRQAALRPRNV